MYVCMYACVCMYEDLKRDLTNYAALLWVEVGPGY